MRTLYLDCGMGAAGDMLTAALLELVDDRDAVVARLNALGIPGVRFEHETSVKCGIVGTHVSVLVDGAEEESVLFDDAGDGHHHDHAVAGGAGSAEHHHHDHQHDYATDADEHHHGHHHDHGNGRATDAAEHHHHGHQHHGMHDVERIVAALDLPQPVKDDVAAVYALIAEAESGVHGVPVSEIHFHEVGTMDAIADVVAACLLMHELEPEQVIASPVNVGSGKVRCAHGVVPVPAPATVRLLQDVPVYSGSVSGELCTPTGAALLKRFVSSFGSMPVMRVDAAGYGMGAHDFEVANCVRALLGETEDRREQVVELRCNIDDMTAEEIGFLVDRLYETGALEAFTGPVNMKKSRPGTLVCVLCREQDTEALVETIFKHSTTIGVRKSVQDRFVLDRRQTEVETRFGTVRRKDSRGYGVARSKLEYDDLSRIAREQDIGLREVREAIEKEHGI